MRAHVFVWDRCKPSRQLKWMVSFSRIKGIMSCIALENILWWWNIKRALVYCIPVRVKFFVGLIDWEKHTVMSVCHACVDAAKFVNMICWMYLIGIGLQWQAYTAAPKICLERRPLLGADVIYTTPVIGYLAVYWNQIGLSPWELRSDWKTCWLVSMYIKIHYICLVKSATKRDQWHKVTKLITRFCMIKTQSNIR